MRPKEVPSWLSRVESLLNEFSFEELGSDEATILKRSFEQFTRQFKDTLSGKGITAGNIHSHSSQTNQTEQSGDSNSEAAVVAKVSHELRTPLNGIIGFTDLLREDFLNETQLAHVNAIQTASYSLMNIINELLEYSKLSAGQEIFESVHFNFHRLVGDVVFLGKTLIVQKNVSLEMVIDPAIPEVLLGDPTKLCQIILNLLGNAIKFIEEGRIDLNIVLKEKKEETFILEFTIADNGIGIAAERLPSIFDPFSQVDQETGKMYGGTGLGLSIVKQIIVQLEGAIAVESTLGQGTTFTFELPFTEGDKSKLRKFNSGTTYLKDGIKLIKGTRILVFEDNTLNQRLIVQRLTRWDCIAFVTDCATYGITLLEEEDIDLVLMDLRMPKLSGFEVSELIRNHKNEAVNQVPIIALTADFTIRDKEESEMHGINDYLLKPFSPDDLLLKLLAHKKTEKGAEHLGEPSLLAHSKVNSESSEVALDHIVDDCAGQLELVAELIQLFKQNVLDFISEVKCHLVKKDLAAMKFCLHKIKSSLAMMRIHRLHEIVLEMEVICKSNGDTKHLNFLFDCFITEYPLVANQIDVELEKFKNNQ